MRRAPSILGPWAWVAILLMVTQAQPIHAQGVAAGFIPPTQDAELPAFFADPDVQWDNVETRPPIFQHRGRFHSIYEDIGPGGPRNSNGNGEWPWAHPSTPENDGLTNNVIGYKIAGVSEHRVSFPQIGIATTHYGGRRGSVARQIRQGEESGLGWTFGDGTDIVELVTNRIGKADYTFKIHRMTLRDGTWFFRVYRPFVTKDAYEAATGTKAVRAGTQRIRSSHLFPAFDRTVDVWKVPRIEPALAAQLLQTTAFKLATDDDFIPTTEHRGQCYPQNYLGAWIGNATDQKNCRTCHQQVALNARRFDNGEWYGQLRGGGHDKHKVGVFSWYADRFLPPRP